MDSPFLPPAPTPPSNSMASNAERSSNLLNLLKFSVQKNAAAAAQHQLQQQQSCVQPQPESLQQIFQRHSLQQGQHNAQGSSIQSLHHQASASNFSHAGPNLYQTVPRDDGFTIAHHSQPQSAGSVGNGRGNAKADQADSEVETIDLSGLPIHQPAPVPADPTGLLAALMRGSREVDEHKLRSEPETSALASVSSGFGISSPGPGPDTRAYLLNLLNRPKPSQTCSEAGEGDTVTDLQDRLEPSATHQQQHQQPSLPSTSTSHAQGHHHPGSNGQHAPVGFYEYQRALQESSQSGYTYRSGSPNSPYTLNAPEQSEYTSVGQADSTHAGSNEPSAAKYQPTHEQHPQEPEIIASTTSSISQNSPVLDPINGHALTTDYLPVMSAPISPRKHDRGTLLEAMQGIADTANREADEALARAEQDSAMHNIAADLEGVLAARTEHDFEQKMQSAAQTVQPELDREENRGLLEAALPPSMAVPVRELVDQAAHGVVAESWESAAVHEETDSSHERKQNVSSPVRVLEFPMRPWISITILPDASELRSQFSDKSVMAVAKLKKDFDQVDRNLYTASQRFMAYGMSKAGGMRVIHQEDGLDTKVFTDTNDRIFNVSMPVTPSDHDGRHREAVVGTAVSGTVYWVELVDGDKNYWQDAHLEQHGFALPPMPAHDQSPSNGVVKTRTRTSNVHPEFFAVGRGKWIHLIWPSIILDEHIFKPGHDRTVNVDRLASRCALRIDMGKASKDFVFSPDDSVVVSLDKSSRVKFWDVRDLTAGAAENPLHPTHRSMELSEQIMSFAAAAEGERGWPTSVLLLDKFKPYQKRTALRYMVVGMKQNHTLQLWDLALGKPVQELHLPHSRENDAVCSISYHAATGILVIGHPTRNSIYFAHLSAPKYNLRPLSQAEYMHKLATGDSALPTPDSTAVISGVREYSFSNLGLLRSLDMLGTPAVQQHDPEEPTLFELYAMHSKGVICLIVKQSDLGWSKDNQIVAPVNAVEVGAIRVEKLKGLLPEAGSASLLANTMIPASQRDETSQPFRIAARTTPRESIALLPSGDNLRRAQDVATRPREREWDLVSQPSPDRSFSAERKQQLRSKKTTGATHETGNAGSTRITDSDRATPVLTEPKNTESGVIAPSAASSTAASQQSVRHALEPLLVGVETRLGEHLSSSITSALQDLHVTIEESNHHRDNDFKVHQSRLLDMVSETLNKNTQTVLHSMIQREFLQSVVPAIINVARKAVNDQISPQLGKMSVTIRDELQDIVPGAVHRALQAQDLSQRISDRVSHAISSKLTEDIVPHLSQLVTDVTVSACQHVLERSQQQAQEQMDHLLAASRADSQRIEHLSSAVSRLTETVMAMASNQAQFQDRLLTSQQLQPQAPLQMPMIHHTQMQGQSGLQLQQQQHGHSQQAVGPNMMLRDADRFERHSQRSQQSDYEYQGLPSHGHGHLHGHPQGVAHGLSHVQGPHQQQQLPSQMGANLGSHLGSHMGSHNLQSHSQGVSAAQTSFQQMLPVMGAHINQEGVVSPASQTSTQAALSRANAYIARQAHSHGVGRTDRPADQVKAYFDARQYEKALLAWIQSGNEDNMFDNLMYAIRPEFMHEVDLPPLVLMSVATTVSQNLQGTHLTERVGWMENTLLSLQRVLSRENNDEQAVRVIPKVMGLIADRIQRLLSDLDRQASMEPISQALRKMLPVIAAILDANSYSLTKGNLGTGYMG